MRAVIYAISPELEAVYAEAALAAGFEPVTDPLLQGACSLLYRDADAIGVLWAYGAVSGAEAARWFREGNVGNRLIILLNDFGPPDRRASDRAMVLRAGADDCQPADIDPRELAARMQALAVRGEFVDPHRLAFRDCVYDDSNGTLRSPNGTVHITKSEGAILSHLGRRPDRTCTKKQIMEALYDNGSDAAAPKIVDVLICKLRRKICAASGGFDVIETVFRQGYRFVPDGFHADPEVWRGRLREFREVAQA